MTGLGDRDWNTKEFATLLHPLTPQEFLNTSWETRPHLIRGRRDKLTPFAMDTQAFEHAVAVSRTGYLKAASPSRSTGESTYRIIDKGEAWACFASGMTLCVTGIDNELPGLKRLALDTQHRLGLAGGVHCNCYLSPEGEGFGVHFDTQSIFLAQIEGSKSWRYGSSPAVMFPREPADGLPNDRLRDYRERSPWLEVTALETTEFETCVLNAGDVLYLPPGTWHRGRANDRSLAVTLTCPTLSVASLVSELLDGHIFRSLPWRRNLPAVPSEQAHDALDEDMQSFARARIRELQQTVARLSAAEVVEAWRSKLDERQDI